MPDEKSEGMKTPQPTDEITKSVIVKEATYELEYEEYAFKIEVDYENKLFKVTRINQAEQQVSQKTFEDDPIYLQGRLYAVNFAQDLIDRKSGKNLFNKEIDK